MLKSWENLLKTHGNSKKEINCEFERRSPFSVQFNMDDLDFDLLPATNISQDKDEQKEYIASQTS